MAYHLVCSYTDTTDDISGERTAYPSGAPEFAPVFVGFVLLGLYVYVCLSFSTFFFVIVLYVLL